MNQQMLVQIVSLVVATLKSQKAQDSLLDFLEDLVARTETRLDDKAILPLIAAYRQVVGVPDND